VLGGAQRASGRCTCVNASARTRPRGTGFRRGTHFFHLENWYSVHALIRNSLRLAGLHARGRPQRADH